ncbi:unnamed protein product [Aureobasidium vineae]|uniref:Serine hydrolase domain-containing protein n=1 Tax=Aureobasidium vineae TaxID=2773715 RepID=A0A9N8K392_9PEZI|nr:unnamed protein product [Aureobasidium vineae]
MFSNHPLLKSRAVPQPITRFYKDSRKSTLRILMLHEFSQSGKRFEQQTKSLMDELRHVFMCAQSSEIVGSEVRDVYITLVNPPFAIERDALPPIDLDDAKRQDTTEDVDAYTWWHLTSKTPPLRCDGLDVTLSSIAQAIHEGGPSHGIIGFSQGAALAVMITSLLEHDRKTVFDKAEAMPYPSAFVAKGTAIQEPLKFVIAMSGIGGVQIPEYYAFYNPKIETPALHILGREDDFI